MTTTATPPRPALGTPRRVAGAAAVFLALAALIAVLLTVHLGQGTAEVRALDIWRGLLGMGDARGTALAVDSRLPRTLAAVVVGAALGLAGGALQAMTRNPLASPDTLAVNGGAHLALTAAAAFGFGGGLLTGVWIAMAGGLLAAGLVLTLSGGPTASPIRLVLAGTVITLGLASITSALLIVFAQSTDGLFAWGQGSLNQAGLYGILVMLPFLGVAALGLLALSRYLDLLGLGDDAARSLGVRVGVVRVSATCLAVLLCAASVTLTGPIGFVGLCAAVAVRLLARWIPGLGRQVLALPAAALAGTALVLAADVLVRAVIGAQDSVEIPTGVVTSVVGAVVLVLMARTVRSTAGVQDMSSIRIRAGRGTGARLTVLAVALAAIVATVLVAMLLGDWWLRLGDLAAWLSGTAPEPIAFTLDFRAPRVAAAFLAGACLALSGGIVQAATRNPLADPAILGISACGGAGAIAVLLFVPGSTSTTMLLGAFIGCALAAIVVFGLATRGGLDQTRMVLVGVGVMTAGQALTALMVTGTDPWNQSRAITWLGGSTFGASWVQQLPMIVGLLIAVPVLAHWRRELDLISLDDETPRLLGVSLDRARLVPLIVAVLLAAVATVSVGVIGFVGLVAPHAARLLVGRNHAWLLPATALLGGLLVTVADVVARTVIAPAQLPAGVTTALIGAPYFLWLLWKSRVR